MSELLLLLLLSLSLLFIIIYFFYLLFFSSICSTLPVWIWRVHLWTWTFQHGSEHVAPEGGSHLRYPCASLKRWRVLVCERVEKLGHDVISKLSCFDQWENAMWWLPCLTAIGFTAVFVGSTWKSQPDESRSAQWFCWFVYSLFYFILIFGMSLIFYFISQNFCLPTLFLS